DRTGVRRAGPARSAVMCRQTRVRRLSPCVTAVEREVHARKSDGIVGRIEAVPVLCGVVLRARPPVDEVVDARGQDVRMSGVDRDRRFVLMILWCRSRGTTGRDAGARER